MQAIKNEIDSDVLGGTVLEVSDYGLDQDFARFEREFVEEYSPRYVVCKVPVESVDGIHALEDRGFRFVEFQVRSELTLRGRFETDKLPYTYQEVQSQNDLRAVLDIAEKTFTDDRFTNDPALARDIGGVRYRRYAQNSFESDNELMHMMVNPNTREVLGFNTCRQVSEAEMLLLIAGVKPEYKATGLGATLNRYVFNDFLDRSIRRVRTHQSGRNYPILNVEVGHFGFRVVQTFVVLRKLY